VAVYGWAGNYELTRIIAEIANDANKRELNHLNIVMNEKPRVESAKSALENEERRLYHELDVALADQADVMHEIDQVLDSTPDRLQAEKIVLEKLAPRMDEATKKVGIAQTAWLAALDKACKSLISGQ